MVKMLIPVENFLGESSTIFPHFGRSPLFALVTLSQDHTVEDITSIQNVGEHSGGHGSAEAIALQYHIDAIVVKGMGPRGLQAFHEKGVDVFTGNVNTVKEALDAYAKGNLSRLTEPCNEARHH